MRKFLKSTTVLALVFATTTAMANDPTTRLTPTKDAKSIIFEMDSQVDESKIRITDGNARTIYTENIPNSTYNKKFNFQGLAVGTYYFTLENVLSSTIYTLDINDKDVTVTNKKEDTIKPIFRKNNTKVSVNLFNGDQGKVVIAIKDGGDNLIFNTTIKGELLVGKEFDFKNAHNGDYVITVNDGEETYYEYISVK